MGQLNTSMSPIFPDLSLDSAMTFKATLSSNFFKSSENLTNCFRGVEVIFDFAVTVLIYFRNQIPEA